MPPRNQPPAAVRERFHQAALGLSRAMRAVDEAGGLSARRASALSVLASRGPQPLGELARAEGVKPPTMSRLVKEMRIEGLVELLAPGIDRREVRIAASPRGRRVMLAARARRIAAVGRLLAGATPAEVRALGTVAALLDRALEARKIAAAPAAARKPFGIGAARGRRRQGRPARRRYIVMR